MRSTSRSEAISRIRVFTGTRPISSRSSCARIEPMSTASNSRRRSTEATEASLPLSCALGTACSVECAMIAGPSELGGFVALALGSVGRVGARGVADVAPLSFLAVKPEAGLMLRPVDDEGEAHRLPAVRGIEAGDADIAVAIDAPAVSELLHDPCGIAQVEHRQAPHLPIGVAGMRIVGELDVHRPALVETILDLASDLLVGQIGKKREAALGNAHGLGPFRWQGLSNGKASDGKARGRNEVRRVRRVVVEGDVLPDLQRLAKGRAGLGGLGQNLGTLVNIVAALVAGEDHGFQRDAVGGRAGRDAAGMADGAAAELQHDVLAEKIEQLVHLAGMDAAGGDRHQLVEARPRLVEEDTVLELHRVIILAADIVIASRGVRIALELADHGAGM